MRQVVAAVLLTTPMLGGMVTTSAAESWSGAAAFYDPSYSRGSWCNMLALHASWGNAIDGWSCDPNGYYSVYPGIAPGTRLWVEANGVGIWTTVGDSVQAEHVDQWLGRWAIELSWSAFTTLGLDGNNWASVSTTGPVTVAKAPTPAADARYFTETNHSIGHGFLAYWEANGGIRIFGLPLTEEFVAADSGLTTQCFERMVLENNPANKDWAIRGRFVSAGCPDMMERTNDDGNNSLPI